VKGTYKLKRQTELVNYFKPKFFENILAKCQRTNVLKAFELIKGMHFIRI
jgi:hypothetical protein